uniref:2-dehydropantoate 2-reductase n=1 Tax=Heterosigma akashiwo TaxID=2829 RepID=A0A7S3XTI6_HETAK
MKMLEMIHHCLVLLSFVGLFSVGEAFGFDFSGSRAWSSSKRSSCKQEGTIKMQTVTIIGSGAVGCYYGARLAEAGHEVTFQVRSGADVWRREGLRVASCLGDITLARPAVVERAAAPADWAVVCLKTYALLEQGGRPARELIAPAVGPGTRILLIMNGLGVEAPVAEWFGPEKVFGGLAFICCNRKGPADVIHSDYGALDAGHFLDDPAELAAVAALFEGSKVELRPQACLTAARWGKLLWNIPFNGISVAMGGVRTDVIMTDPDLREMAYRVMLDVRDSGNLDLEAQGKDARIGMDKVDTMMELTDNMAPYKTSTMLDFVSGRPLELDFMFSTALARAKELGGEPKYMESLIRMVRAADRQKQQQNSTQS